MGHLVDGKAGPKIPSRGFLNKSFFFKLLSPVYGLGFSYLQNSKIKTLQQLLEGYLANAISHDAVRSHFKLLPLKTVCPAVGQYAYALLSFLPPPFNYPRHPIMGGCGVIIKAANGVG